MTKQSTLSKLASKIAASKKRSIKKQKVSKSSTRKVRAAKLPRFDSVSTINTAPVSIGNSVRGSEMKSSRSKNGAVVTGRDFCFSPIGTGTITTWCEVGGTPLTPAAFVDSKIRSYLQLYQKYRWRRCIVHYITSSSTATTGDVLFYYNKNRDSVYLNQTNPLLLPFVMSDPSTVLGPQWLNHSAELQVTGTWKSTDYGMTNDINEYADGEIFLLSKTASTSIESPGYVLMDYEIEFAQEQLAPRLQTLPIARIQYNNVSLGAAGAATANNVAQLGIIGNNLSGVTSVQPTDWVVGDVFKIHIDSTNSTFTTGTRSNILALNTGTSFYPTLTISDGFTCYAVKQSATLFELYPNSTAAYSGTAGQIVYQTTQTVSFAMNCWFSYIGQIGTNSFISNY